MAEGVEKAILKNINLKHALSQMYGRLAEKAEKGGAQAIFHSLMLDEERNAYLLTYAYRRLFPDSRTPATDALDQADFMKKHTSDKKFNSRVEEVYHYILKHIQLESEVTKDYRNLRYLIEDVETKKIFAELIRDEDRHHAELSMMKQAFENMYAKILHLQ